MSEELLENVEVIIERYYYKDNNGSYYSLKQERDDLIPITEQEFNEHIESIRTQIQNFKNPYKNARSVYSQPQRVASLVEVEA